MYAEPERGAGLHAVSSLRAKTKEMQGPQGLDDAGAEAKTERARDSRVRARARRFRRSPSLPPDAWAASRVSSDSWRTAFGCAAFCSLAWLQGSGRDGKSPTSALGQQCRDGHSGVDYRDVVNKCKYLFSAGAENCGMATGRHEEARKRQLSIRKRRKQRRLEEKLRSLCLLLSKKFDDGVEPPRSPSLSGAEVSGRRNPEWDELHEWD